MQLGITLFAYLVVHLFRTVEHVHHNSESFSQIFGGFCLTCSGWTSRSTTHGEMEGLGECDVAAISQWSDHKSSSIAKVLIRVLELGITDVCKAMVLGFIPPEE